MILFGASGHSRSVINVAESIGQKITAIYDDNPETEALCDIPVEKFIKNVSGQKENWLISIGHNKIRKQVSNKLQGNYSTLIHRTASISKWSRLGKGSVVMANVVVNSCVEIGDHCIINTGAIIEHDCVLESFVHISPNASLAGGVSVGEGTHIGIGASVIPGIKIGKWVTIGAGAVIIKDIPDDAVVVGNPGRIIK